MHSFDMLLLFSTLAVLVWPLLPARWKQSPWLNLLPTLNVLLALAHYWREGLRPSIIPVSICAGLLWLLTLRQLARPILPMPPQHTGMYRIVGIAGRGLGIMLLSLSLVIRAVVVTDLSGLGWTAAFKTLHTQVSRTYAFGTWKAVDWDALYDEVAPQIASAEARDDQQAYYRALRRYAFALRDNHVSLIGNDHGARAAAIGGGYGFGVIRLDDGRTIAHSVQEGSPAARAGMVWGAEIVDWNDLPIARAVQEVSTIWSDVPAATSAGQRITQYRLLTRAPVGTPVQVTFINPGTAARTVTLIAVDDQLEIFNHTYLTPHRASSDPPIQARVLPGGYGYIRISREGMSLGQLNPMRVFHQAIDDAVARNAPGMIIDVRGNSGGADQMVADIASYFYTHPAFYEKVAPYDEALGQANTGLGHTIMIEPRTPHYAGPLAVLIDPDTKSSGEGIPLVLGRLPQTTLIGFAGTHGSFGAPSQFVQLPGGYLFIYTGAQSLDEQGQIQVDSDASGQGGVLPDVRVPVTEETVHAVLVEGRDVVLDVALYTFQSK